jgi:hypothetical protein
MSTETSIVALNSGQAPSPPPLNGIAGEASADPPDPFAPESLRLDRSHFERIGVKKILTHVRVGKPNRQEWVRVNPDPGMRVEMAIIEMKETREAFAVDPAFAETLPEGECKIVNLVTAITRQGTVFLWPLKIAGNRRDAWAETADKAAKLAETQWVRLTANMADGAYEVFTASGNIPDPQWPEHSLRDLLKVAFGGNHLITDEDHPALRELLGRQ